MTDNATNATNATSNSAAERELRDIVHDHESVPFDPAIGQAAISLRPQRSDS